MTNGGSIKTAKSIAKIAGLIRGNMGKIIYALHPVQQKLIDKYCFGICGKILVGGLIDDIAGAMFPCRQKKCLYEEKRLKYGKVNGEICYIRKLRGIAE